MLTVIVGLHNGMGVGRNTAQFSDMDIFLYAEYRIWSFYDCHCGDFAQ